MSKISEFVEKENNKTCRGIDKDCIECNPIRLLLFIISRQAETLESISRVDIKTREALQSDCAFAAKNTICDVEKMIEEFK